MSGLFKGISDGEKALEVYMQSLQVTGRNIDNVVNEEYARQKVSITTLGSYQGRFGIESLGVDVEKVTHARSKVLDDQITRETMTLGSLQAQESFTNNIEAYFTREIVDAVDSGDKNSSGGFSGGINAFFNAFHGLAAQPEELSEKTVVLDRGVTLVDQFHTLDSELKTVDADIVEQSNADVREVNLLLDKIAKINDQIIRLEVGSSGEALDLRDQRQAALEDLAGYINFTTNFVDVTKAGTLQIIVKDITSSDVILVDRNQLTNQIAFDGTNVTTAGGSPVTLSLTGGSLYGYQQVRSTTLSSLTAKLDNLANQFVTSVNAAYNPTSSTGDFFAAAGTTAATIALETGLTISTLKTTDTTNQGDSELALAVAELDSQVFSTGGGDSIDGTYSTHFTGMVVDVGLAVKSIEQKIENQDIVSRSLSKRRNETNGVSLNEETADLMATQKTIQAISHFIRVIDKLLDLITQL